MPEKPSGQEFGPEQEERARFILELYRKGLDDPRCIGYHGTSVQALNHTISSGVLPASVMPDHPQTIHFYPRDFSRFPELQDNVAGMTVDTVLEATESYAYILARGHALLELLKLNFDDPKLMRDALDLASPHDIDEEWKQRIYHEFLAFGFTKRRLNAAIRDARKMKGVILSLNPDILENYEVGHGDPGGGDLKITCPNGIDCRFLSGIKALGPKEKSYFEDLESRLS